MEQIDLLATMRIIMGYILNRPILLLGLCLGVVSSVAGCLPTRRLTIGSMGLILEDVAKASAKQTDVSLVREGLAAYLILLDGMVEAYPKDRRILLAAADAYRTYAALVSAQRHPEDAGSLYVRGKEYALRAMPDEKVFRSVLSQPVDALAAFVDSFSKKDVPVLFSFASCWAGCIGMAPESVRSLADLPRVVLLMERIIALDETHDHGGAHLFMGIYESARPKAYGGKPEKARRHFERAIQISRGNFLMAHVYYAEHYARMTLNKELFTALLAKVLETPADRVPELTLINTLAKGKAKELLSHVEEYF
jgi:hypothetical protein